MSGADTHLRSCHLCEAMCGVSVHVEGGRVTRVRPNPEDVWSHGYLCPKGTTLGHLQNDADRLRAPMVRNGATWREVSWDEAFARCEEIIHGILERHGRSALAARTGNAVGRSSTLSRYVAAFSQLARITRYTSSVVDQQPKNLACQLMYGDAWKMAVPDIARTDYFLVMGANPAESKGSILSFPDVLAEIERIRQRGGRTVVIDPVRTRTAKRADEWIPIVPGSDALFLLAMAQVLFADDLIDLGRLEEHVNGVERLGEICREFTPESVAAVCGIPAETIRRLAHELSAAPTAAVYGRIGLCTQEFGTLASWLTDVIAILTGHFDTPGGLMFANPVAPFMEIFPIRPFSAGSFHSRVRGAPEVLGEVPAACLAEEIDTPGEGQLKGLITLGCNPVVSAPDSDRLDAALPLLEGMISIDLYRNETTRHADVVFPATPAFEQPYSDVWSWIYALRSGIKYNEPLLPSPPDWVPEWQILLRLGALCAGMTNDEIDIKQLDDAYFTTLCTWADLDPDPILEASPEPGPKRIIDMTIRTGPWGDRFGERPDGITLETVLAAPNGLDFGPAIPRLPQMLETESGKIELAPDYIVADIPRLRGLLERNRPSLVLVGRRHARSLNSWMHNVEVLVKGKDRCTLQIHPDDASRTGLSHAGLAKVSNDTGSVTVTVEVSDDITPGVVSLPHGWGHDRDGTQMDVAKRHAGVGSNVVSPGDLLDTISGNAVLNGIPVRVEPAEPLRTPPELVGATT
jgi:anaerobic selenocysteine-containing dehydrogenase